MLARDHVLSVEDYVCDQRACSPRTERVHARAAIAVVIAGTFQVRAREGTVLLAPGALLVKRAGGVHEYGHVDDAGDRTIVFEYEPELLAELGGGRELDRLAIPPSAGTAAAVALAAEAAGTGDRDALRAAALELAAVACAWEGTAARAADPTPAQLRRVARAVRHVAAHAAGDCSDEALAAIAGLSVFHFIRLFRAATGQTPRQHVIATRLRAAAAALRATHAPVTEIAADVGFNDLSHFVTSFRHAFGVSPRAFRRRDQKIE